MHFKSSVLLFPIPGTILKLQLLNSQPGIHTLEISMYTKQHYPHSLLQHSTPHHVCQLPIRHFVCGLEVGTYVSAKVAGTDLTNWPNLPTTYVYNTRNGDCIHHLLHTYQSQDLEMHIIMHILNASSWNGATSGPLICKYLMNSNVILPLLTKNSYNLFGLLLWLFFTVASNYFLCDSKYFLSSSLHCMGSLVPKPCEERERNIFVITREKKITTTSYYQ